MEWYRHDQAAVREALRAGQRPDLATTMASGPLDELVALHQELGIFAIVDAFEVQRRRAGIADELLLRTLATLPFVEQASLSGASEVLFREPAILLQLGWAPVQIRQGSNGRHRHPEGRQEESLPCHPDTLRDALRRVEESAWLQAQIAGVQALYQRQLVRGKVYAVDGSGVGDGLRLVALVCVSATRPMIVAWRLLSGAASEKGKEAAVTRSLIEQVLQVAGPQAISLLLADALYADGPLLAWLKYAKGIDALVSLPEDRLLYQDLQGLADAGLIAWSQHRYVRTIAGHKQVRQVEVTAAAELTSWDGFTEAAASYGVDDASLWACLIHDVTTPELAAEPARALVSTRHFADGFAALQAYRPRWHIEDDTFRELKEGWGLEKQHWGRDFAAVLGRTTLTCLAFNTAQVYRLQAGERLAAMAIRRLRRLRQPELGRAPAVLYVAGCYGVFSLEELLDVLGAAPRESLLPTLTKPFTSDSPT
jgi:Transposase DDE domain